MALKRKANDSEIPVGEPKRRHEDTRQKEIILSDANSNVTCMGGGINYSQLEAIIRKVLQEELARYLSPRVTPSQYGEISEAKRYQLRFTNKLKEVYYAQNEILAEGDAPVQIGLFDGGSQSIVSDGPMSSVTIEICVLPGEFGSDRWNWTREEFNANILRPREGKKALLKGKTSITLKDGVGLISEIEFTDSSCWVRTGKFRLAVKSNEANIKEAASEPCIVKDKRGEPFKKSDQPSLADDIWRLRNIGKGGKIHGLLSNNGIEKVKDLMRLYTTNPSLLKEIFGGISRRRRESIIKHAKACVIDDNERYCYYAAESQICMVFNSIYEVVKVSFSGQNYRSPETLNPIEKQRVEVVKQQAYQNEKDFIPVPGDLAALGNLPVGQFSGTQNYTVPPQFDLLPAQQWQEFDLALLSGCGSQTPLSFSFPFPSDFPSTSLGQPIVFPFEGECSNPFQSLHNSDATMPSYGTRKKVWNKIRAALKWVILRKSLCR